MSTSNKSVFIKGAAILSIAGLICKVIGAFYRIALVNILSPTGMAYYEMAYPIYSFLLVLASAGIPTAISKLVSEKVAINDYRGAHRTFQVAYKAMAAIGFVTAILLFAGAKFYARFAELDLAFYALWAIAPSLFFVSVISAYRGYFQGLQMMNPTAVSQVVEQVGKLVLGFALAGMMVDKGLHFGAMGALLGVTISEFIAMLLLIVMYNMHKGDIKANMRLNHDRMLRRQSDKSILKMVIIVSLPMTIGSSIMPLVSMTDTVIVMKRLISAGFAERVAQDMYGVYVGSITSVINMPAVLSLSLGMSLVPAIAAALAIRDHRGAQSTANIGLKMALLIGLPCAAGLYLCAQPVLNLLYGRSLTAEQMTIAVRLLEIMAFAVLFLTIVQTLTSVIQGYGKFLIPVYNLVVGAVVKIVVSIILVGMPSININGAAIGTLCCYGVASILNIITVFRLTKLKFSLMNYVLRPLLATGIMSAFVYFTLPLFTRFAGSNIALMVTILVACLIYALAVVGVGALRPEDMDFMPGGRKLERLLYRAHIWRER